METNLQHTPLGYFKFFYRVLGIKLVFNMFLAILLGAMDGIGLALFLPLLQFVNEPDAGASQSVSNETMGGMSFLIDSFDAVGLPLNLFSVLGLMVVVFFLKGSLNYWLTMEQVDLRQKYMIKLRLNQIKDLRKLSYQGFLKLDAGRIQNVVTTEVGKNIQALIQFLNSSKAVVVLSSYIMLAFISNWKFALFILIGGYLSNFLYQKITTSVKSNSVDISKRNSLFSGYIIQAVHNFKYLKATNYFGTYAVKLREVIKQVEKLNRKIGRSQAVTLSSREPVIVLIVAVVILLQVRLMGSSLGSILLSLMLFYRALNSLVAVQMAWQSFMQNVGGLQAVSDLTEAMKDKIEVQPETKFEGFKNQVELKNLNFSYGNNRVIDGIDLLVPKNQTIALVGESGSGKSTLANIITTLLKPESGQLLVDGQDIYQYNLESFRGKVGYITQEPVIFADDIFNNVTFWAEKSDENLERFWEVMKRVSLYDFVSGLEAKEETMLGDNGMMVSGGQKQRISIARELYKDVDILILDEATSALDTETERFIQTSIDDLQGEYTIVVIAHRLSTIQNANIIYLIDHGHVSASGNYDQLLGKSERFQKMVSLQHV